MTTNREKDGTPVLYGFLDRHERGTDLRVWCRWCCHWHIHGPAGNPTGAVTHRIEHCSAPDSGYQHGGYWIEITNAPFSAAKKMVRSATAAQRRAISVGRISAAVKRLREQPDPEPIS